MDTLRGAVSGEAAGAPHRSAREAFLHGMRALVDRRTVLKVVAPLVVLCTMLSLLRAGYRDDSPTEDEWAHVIRGIAYYEAPDTRLHYSHPPFANAVMGLPNAGDTGDFRFSKAAAWKKATVGEIALEYIQRDYAHAKEQLFRGRQVAMAFGLALAVYVYVWCLSWFGPTTALAALALLAWNPTVLAQFRYVTTDGASAAMTTIAVGEFLRFVRGGRLGWVTMPLALALAVLTKHSAVLLVPIFAALGAAAAIAGVGRFRDLRPGARVKRVFYALAATGAFLLLAINAAYRFDRTFMRAGDILAAPEPEYVVSRGFKGTLLEKNTPLAHLPAGLRVPLPYTYVFGLASVRALNARGYGSFFMGERESNGRALYFPTLLAVKDPPSLLFFLLAGAALALRSVKRVAFASWALAGTALLLLVSSMSSHLNMGVRHAMPIVPLLTILGARGFDAALAWTPPDAHLVRTGLLGVLGSTAVSAAGAAPHYLGYFNLLAGSAEHANSISVVGDDWGQDRAAFAAFVREHALSPLYYHEQTATRRVEIASLGVKYTPLSCATAPKPGSWAAVHVFALNTSSSSCFRWARSRRPVTIINGHVYVYWIPAGEEQESSAKPGDEAAAAELD